MTIRWNLDTDGAFILPPTGHEIHHVVSDAYLHEWNSLAGPSLNGRTELAIVGTDHQDGPCRSHLHSCVRASEVIAVVPNAE